jgi:hypothetical protein
VFPPEVRAAYTRALRNPSHAHAVCEEYRAAATIDREHDRADRASGRRIGCPLLVLWTAQGPVGTWYAEEGSATFTAGDEEIEVSGNQVVVVPAGLPHTFMNSGTERLRQVDIHASERFVTEWLEA